MSVAYDKENEPNLQASLSYIVYESLLKNFRFFPADKLHFD